MKNNLSEVLRAEQTAVKTAFLSYYISMLDLVGKSDFRTKVKTAFLSYYISMYNAVNKEIGYEDTQVTVDEIYDFIQDLKHEARKQVPEITKEDISFCFHLLQVSGICRP